MAEPFRIDVPDEVIDDLHRRLEATRWPQTLDGVGWDYGSDTAYIAELCRYWRHEFDWRTHEAALNKLPHFIQRIDGLNIHFLHVQGQGPDPLPLVITHGWPSCFWEMHKVVGPLTDPASHGGDPADAFHVVVPSLPGYGFSSPPAQPGVSSARVADMWAELMVALGYERFGAQGGDWGSAVSAALGALHRHPPEHGGPAD